jgi:cellulose synthase (UDP-forming)
LLRRTTLEEIGGFQVETVTEDIHTSLLLHAKGYKSCYLNEALASGLMPENFETHATQRARWATGTAQMLMRNNPLFMRGLTFSQRLSYFGSIHYFFFGLPRIIYLIAPLSWLIFSIPALKADTSELINFFFSAYIGSVLALQIVSRNTRNAFWSDVHETVMCFAVAAAAFVGLTSGNKSREFVVTPKGRRSEKRSYASVSAAGWHVAVFGLLIFGISNGMMQWYAPSPPPGLSISLWWASFNLVLVTVAILPAREQPQLRNFVRRAGRIPCLLLDESSQTDAEILDVSESGAALRIPAPWYSLQKHIRIAFKAEEDELLTVNATIVRQELDETGEATVGVQFGDLDDRTIQALVSRSFVSSNSHRLDASAGAGVFSSLWSLLSVLSRFRERLQPSRRLAPRLSRAKACRLEIDGMVLQGTIRDVSFAGVSAVFPGRHDVRSQACSLSIEDVGLTVSPIESFNRGGGTLVRFRVESISKGASKWQAWHQPS